MALDSPIKFQISLAKLVTKPTLSSRVLSVFPSYFSKFTGISPARSLRRVITSLLSILVCPIDFSPVSRSIRIV